MAAPRLDEQLCARLIGRRGSVFISARATKGSITAIINLNEIGLAQAKVALQFGSTVRPGWGI